MGKSKPTTVPSKTKKKTTVKKHGVKNKTPLATKHKEFLYLLAKAKNGKKRKGLIDIADSNEVRAVLECIHNLLIGNVSVTDSQLKTFRRYRNTLRQLALKCNPLAKKRALLKQKGGFLGALLPVALSAIGGLLPQIFGK